MTLRRAKEKLGKIDWYVQGSAAKIFYLSYPWYACSEMRILGKKIPLKYEILLFIEDIFFDFYISKRSLKKVAIYYYNRQIRNKNFIKNLYNKWHKKFVSLYLKLVSQILKDDFSQYSNQELLFLFRKFSRIYVKIWSDAIFLDSFDYYGEIILKKILFGKNIEVRDLEILISPPLPSFLQKERLSLLSIAENILKKPKTLKLILDQRNYKEAAERYFELRRYLVKHSNKYHWLHNDHATVEYLSPSYFYRNLLSLLKDKTKLKNERNLRRFVKNLDNKKKEVFKKYEFSTDSVNIINFLALLGNFRDERKTCNQMANSILKKFASEFSRGTGLKTRTIENLFFWEIKDVFNLKLDFIKEIESRDKSVSYIAEPSKKNDIFKGKSARKLNDYLKKLLQQKSRLQGMPVYRGIVKGEVKIIRGKKDFDKMKRGDILVAPNTRPEYIPIMKIAGAVVTEEGGITCHAAIVSRELKIPSVVGIQGVIGVLKNGDRVEVDADKGIIKILK